MLALDAINVRTKSVHHSLAAKMRAHPHIQSVQSAVTEPLDREARYAMSVYRMGAGSTNGNTKVVYFHSNENKQL